MITLDVPAPTHPLGVREGGHVAEDEIPAVLRASLLAHPLHNVCLHVLVLGTGEAVLPHIAPCPVERGTAQVDARRVLAASVRRVAAYSVCLPRRPSGLILAGHADQLIGRGLALGDGRQADLPQGAEPVPARHLP